MAAVAPIELSHVLASEYGHVLEPINYVRGVAISGRLRLHQLAPERDDPVPSIVGAVEPALTEDTFARLHDADGSVHAGFVWANELSAVTGDARYATYLARIADLYLEARPDGTPLPIDPDARVEDIFCAGSVLGRAFESTGDPRYASTLGDFLARVHPQPDSGLWWHCNASPYYWGRGNAFAALGFADALSALPDDHPGRDELERTHREHLRTLMTHQHPSGAWHQVIDRPDSYRELTATAMIGCAATRGMARGWLGDEFEEPVARAWEAVAARVDAGGLVTDACMGTGPLATLDEYLNRPTVDGHDDRAGSMALWFGVEYAAYLVDRS